LSKNATPEIDSADLKSAAPFVCARRQLLLGASVGGVALVAAACGGSSSNSGSSTQSIASTGANGSAAGSSAGANSAPTTGFIALSKIPSDSAVSVKDPTGRILLMTQSGGKLTALSSVCPHQGCTVAPDNAKLACPCHGSTFALTGAVEQGPATGGLDNVAVKVEGGQVLLA
jgi:cytochrome b6-f complex iron-sulfur subunit